MDGIYCTFLSFIEVISINFHLLSLCEKRAVLTFCLIAPFVLKRGRKIMQEYIQYESN